MNKHRTIKQVVQYVLGLLITLCIVILGVHFGILFGLFNKSAILTIVQKNDYYNHIYKEVITSSEDILYESLEKTEENKSFIEDVITFERVYISSKNYIEDTLDKKENPYVKEVASSIKKELKDKMLDYLIEKGVTITKDMEVGMDEVATKISKNYERILQFGMVHYIARYDSHYRSQTKVIIPVIVMLVLLMTITTVGIERYKHRGVRKLTISFIAAALLILTISVGYLLTKQASTYDISPFYYSQIIRDYLNNWMKTNIFIGGAYVVISLLGIYMTQTMKKNRIKKGSR